MTRIDARSSTAGQAEPTPFTVLCQERCHLGEGPSYDEQTDTAWWFDILGKKLFEAQLGTGRIVVHDLPVMASALARIDARRQLLCAQDGLYLRDIASGEITRAVEIDDRGGALRSNDARVHPSGTLWTSTMSRSAETGAAAILAFRDGRLTPVVSALTIPNAICFSPDGATGYFADTHENVLFRVRLDPTTGLPVEPPSQLHKRRDAGGLDGAVTDAEGLIWCAIWGGASIDVYTPDGERVRRLATPASQPSCPAFVGRRFDRLLVTSAYENMSEEARVADPEHGRTFLLDIAGGGASVHGRAEPRLHWEGR